MPKDWDRHKAEIKNLYIIQRKTLKEVQRLLKGKYNFIASTRAYRMRLEEWGVKKNKSSDQRTGRSGPIAGRRNVQQERESIQHANLPPSHPAAHNDAIFPGPSAHIAPPLQMNESNEWSHNSFAMTVNNGHNLDGYSFGPGLLNPTTALPSLRVNDIEFPNHRTQSDLHDSILSGSVEDVNTLLASGASVSTLNAQGNQPLHEAIIKDNIQIIKLLLKYGADVNAAGFEGNVPLHLATSSLEIMKLLRKYRPNISHQDMEGNTVLHRLLQNDNWQWNENWESAISALLSDGADINFKNRVSETPFYILITKFASFSRYDKWGLKVILRIILKFLQLDPDISTPQVDGSLIFNVFLERLSRYSPLSTRSWYYGDYEIICQCLQRFLLLGGSANATPTLRKSLLQFCLEQDMFYKCSGFGELLMLILKQADLNIIDRDGNSVLHHLLETPSAQFSTLEYSKLDCLKVLVGRQADVNHRNATGFSALEVLLEIKDEPKLIEHATCLLGAGATPMRLASKGRNMFELVIEGVSLDMQTDLIKAFLEMDLALQPELTSLMPYVEWAAEWRAACNELNWTIAKRLLQFHSSYSRPTSTIFTGCTFVVIAEKFLKMHKAQLDLWQAGRLEHEPARLHREEYVAVLKDCKERQAAIDPSWYRYLLEIIDFN